MFFYLATVYSSNPGGLGAAFIEASMEAAALIKHKVPVYCPIAHTHPIAIHGGMDPYDHDIWMPADTPFMEAARGLIVVKMTNWQVSKGIGMEIKKFTADGKPIFYKEPGEPTAELLAALRDPSVLR